MPLYLFEHVRTGEVHEVVYHMNDTKDYAGPRGDQKGQWRRVWIKPRASIDTRVDPYSARDFSKATAKGGVIGDLWDRAREMSIKRTEKEGFDSIKQQHYAEYSRRRGGKKHPEQRREECAREAAKAGMKIDFGEDD